MTNEKKARELAIKSTKHIDDNGKEVYDALVEAALQEMAEWKDRQWENFIKKTYDKLNSIKYKDRIKTGFNVFFSNLMTKK